MGGGAGINFEFKLDGLYARWSRKRGLFVPCRCAGYDKNPTIESFDAVGYMDGMSDVDGRFLKVTGFEIDKPHPEDAAYFNDRFTWNQPVWISFRGKVEEMIWKGYTRGTKEQVFPMPVGAECKADGSFVGPCGFIVEIADKNAFDGWWSDAFDAWSQVAPDEWEDFERDRQTNWGKAA